VAGITRAQPQQQQAALAKKSLLPLESRFVHVKSGTPTCPVGAFETQSAFVIDGDSDSDEDFVQNEEIQRHDTRPEDLASGQRSDLGAQSLREAAVSPQKSSSVSKPHSPMSHGVSVRRTDIERAQALSLHKMAGLRKGDQISISKEFLPGAVLFPSLKYKVKAAATTTEEVASLSAADNGVEFEQIHRYLVVTKERFLVLDANGGGVGSTAMVKSNHHLTEVIYAMATSILIIKADLLMGFYGFSLLK
jgi:hypothetical protein